MGLQYQMESHARSRCCGLLHLEHRKALCFCERGVVDQRGTLLIRGNAKGFSSEPIHIEDEVKDQEDEVEDGRDK